ncbi:MAG: glycoside hydrolase family 95 protein [Clostridia bacterium]|nr:glycoside hydrolase family 95 protein [Clostridia bacterium]
MGLGSHVLWYNHPAKEWVEALPLGNGSLGAMVFGGVDKEKVGLNLDTLWSGYSHKYAVDNKYEHFVKARELTLEGKMIEARDYIEENFVGDDCEWYVQLGRLMITSNIHQCARKYRRELDIATGVTKTEYTANDTVYTREAFISHPDKVLVYSFRCEGKKKLDFNTMINCDLKYEVETVGDTYILRGECPSHIDFSNDPHPAPEYCDGDKKGVQFTCMFRILTDGTLKTNKKHLTVSDATNATIILTAESNFEAWDKPLSESRKDYEGICRERLASACLKSFDELKTTHIADHSALYNRVSIDLGNSKKDGTPTNRRLHEFLYNKNNDNDLYCLLFNYGRYLTIAGSRAGSQAMTLQGIWTFRMCSPWRSNYTTNINTEMNYWPTMTCSLPELNQPLIDFIKELSVSGQEVAKEYYNARGFCVHHNVDLWRIPTPSKGNPVWSFWPMAGAWFCRHLFEQYEYTLDKDFLKDTALPIMESAARFCLDMLIEDKDGYLIFCPATSPENEYKIGREDCSVSETAYMTMGIIRDLFKNIMKTADILGAESEVIDEIKAKYEKLLPFRTGSKGQLLEWYKDEVGFDQHHRHVSHLYALFPSDLINVDDTPELAQAARRTLELRGDNGTGWSLGWKINFWARLRDKDKVIKLINNQLRYINPKYTPGRGGTFPNMFDAHPPFQIDGNFGATSGIAQALMQSFENRILILPALPDKWADGHIHGLTAKGGVKVNIDWADGKLTKLTLDGNGDYVVIYGDKKVNVTLNGKKDVEI